MYKMYFNTGVTPSGHNPPIKPVLPFQTWRGGTLQVEYHLEHKPPQGARLLWLCSTLDTTQGRINIKIVGGGMLSGYAIFHLVREILTAELESIPHA